MAKTKTQAVAQLQKRKLNPLEAAVALDTEIGGITKAVWNPGAGVYKVWNHNKEVPLPARGATKRQYEKLGELAALSYGIAQQNGYWEAGEVHLSKKVSSKHHEFAAHIAKLRTQYAA